MHHPWVSAEFKYRKTLCLSPQMIKIFPNLGGGLDNKDNIFLNFFLENRFLSIMIKFFRNYKII